MWCFFDCGLFRVAVTANAATGFAESSFIVNSPPTGGYVTVSPSSGVRLNTTFTISASQWSEDTADLPLYYSFSYYTGNQTAETLLTTRRLDNTYSTVINAVGTVTIVTRISDRWGASTVYTVSANLTEAVVTNVTQFLTSFVENAITAAVSSGDLDSVNSQVSALGSLVNDPSLNVSESERDAAQLQLLTILTNSTTEYTSELASIQVNCLAHNSTL
jgi:hypothetical protein